MHCKMTSKCTTYVHLGEGQALPRQALLVREEVVLDLYRCEMRACEWMGGRNRRDRLLQTATEQAERNSKGRGHTHPELHGVEHGGRHDHHQHELHLRWSQSMCGL